jgi:membrane fusion protein, multidrug efflux system
MGLDFDGKAIFYAGYVRLAPPFRHFVAPFTYCIVQHVKLTTIATKPQKGLRESEGKTGMAMSKRGKWAALLIALLAIGGTAATVAKRVNDRKVAEQKREAEAKKPKIIELVSTDILAVTETAMSPMLALTGALEPSAQGVAKARAVGTLVGAAKREGDAVRKGEVLGSVDAADLRMRLAQQEGLRAQVMAQYETARKNRAAQQALLDKGFISKTAFDNADGSYLAAKASVDAAQAQVNMANQAIRDTTIVSPMEGIVARRHVEPGERVTNEMTVYTLVQIDALEFAPQVPVEEAAKLRIGQELDVSVPGENASRKATIVRIAPMASAATRTIDVRARMANADRALKAGTPVTGNVALAAVSAAITIPLEALRAADSAPHVFVLEGEAVKRVNVKLGARDEKRALMVITDGVKPGARIVSARVQDLKDGQNVRVMPKNDAKVPTPQVSVRALGAQA